MNDRDAAVRLRAALDIVLDWGLGFVSGPEALRAASLADEQTRAVLRYAHRHQARDKLLADVRLQLQQEAEKKWKQGRPQW